MMIDCDILGVLRLVLQSSLINNHPAEVVSLADGSAWHIRECGAQNNRADCPVVAMGILLKLP